MQQHRVFVDFSNTDGQGRIRLNTPATTESLYEAGIVLEDGMGIVVFDNDDEELYAVVSLCREEHIWVASTLSY